MAFRASGKPAVKKSDTPAKIPAKPEETSQPVAKPLSIEDLIGKPVSETSSVKKNPDEPPVSVLTEKPTENMTKAEPAVPVSEKPISEPFYGGYRPSVRPAPLGRQARSMRDFGRFSRRPISENGAPRFGETNNGYSSDLNVPTETMRGVLDIMPEGHGFLRPKYTPSEKDIYISQSQIRRFLLRNGDMVEGQARPPKENERYWGLLKVEKVNEQLAESVERRPKFEDLVPVYPNKLLKLETEGESGGSPFSTRMVDLIAPIGFGQRGLIVSPPKAGKTTILKEIAAGVSANYPGVHLMAALIGERPEEVTDISRSVKGEVFASNFDESPGEQTRIAEVALDRAKRLVEIGHDVVILLDSITRLARAYNLVVNPSGRTLSGGFDPAALYPAKRFLGAARCVELTPLSVISSQLSDKSLSVGQLTGKQKTDKQISDNRQPTTDNRVTVGGSLTIIGTALVDTGSRMDDLIYEEFKGTGNMELHLSRVLQERRIFPAIDVGRSGTRHDELLLGQETMKKVITLRHMLSLLSDEERTMMLIERLTKTKNNAEFLDSLSQG